MKSFGNRIWLRWLISLMVAVLLLFLAVALLSRYAERRIQEAIASQNGAVSSIAVNVIRRSIVAKDLRWRSDPDTTRKSRYSVNATRIDVTGIQLYELIAHKRVVVQEILLDSGKLYVDQSVPATKQNQDSAASRQMSFLAKRISWSSILIQVHADSLIRFSGLFNGSITDLKYGSDSSRSVGPTIQTIDAEIKKISISRQEGMYGATISKMHMNTKDSSLVIDSLLVIPNFDKFDFAHHLGTQTARVNLFIPRMEIEGIRYDKVVDSVFEAAVFRIKSFDLNSFKDKRIPFLRKNARPLPMEVFLKLPYHVMIDTVLVMDSHVVVEEIPVNGTESGTVTFDHIQATLIGLNNRIVKGDTSVSVLKASGLIMGSGKIDATFTLPQDGSPNYRAFGSISDMPFSDLNPMLFPMTQIRIESGHLNKLFFDFTYTDFRSTGNLNIDYRDLQLTSVSKNGKSSNDLKSLFINVFVKSNRNRSSPAMLGNGEIDIECDRKKLIFNVWLKSILDGLKSAMLRTGKSKDSATPRKR